MKTVVLFFEKGAPSTGSGQATKKVWFYQLNLERNLGKTNPLNENDLADFVKLFASRTSATGAIAAEGPETPNSWNVDATKVTELAEVDLSVKNPHKQADSALRDPLTILDEMKSLDEESAKILKAIKGML